MLYSKDYNKKLFLFYLLCSCFIGILPDDFSLVADFLILLSVLFPSRNYGKFKKFYYFVLFFFCCSILSCLYFEGQSIFLSLTSKEMLIIIPLFSYFYMIKHRNAFDIDSIEKTFVLLYFLVIFIFILQYVAFPSRLVNLATFIEREKRFTLYGQTVSLLCYFYFLNKYILTRKNKYLLYALPEILCVLLQGFRSYLIAIIATSLLMFLRIGTPKALLGNVLKVGLVISIIGMTPIANNAIQNMIDRQNVGATFDNEDYIRVREFEYFTTEHFNSPVEYILGSGLQNPRSSYGSRMLYLQSSGEDNGHLGTIGGWRDWGMVGLSWEIGFFTVLLLYIGIGVFLYKKLPLKYHYLKYYYLFILITSISSVEYYRVGSVCIHGILFFLLELIEENSDGLEELKRL